MGRYYLLRGICCKQFENMAINSARECCSPESRHPHIEVCHTETLDMEGRIIRVDVYVPSSRCSGYSSLCYKDLITGRQPRLKRIRQHPRLLQREVTARKACCICLTNNSKCTRKLHTLHLLPSLLQKPTFAYRVIAAR